MFDTAAYLDQLQQLLPPGRALPRDPDAALTALLAAIAEAFARIDARAGQLADEADPRTTLEMLPDWERLVGLPDTCAGTIASTVPERRAAIVAKLTARGGQSIAYLTALAAGQGYAVLIGEYRASRLPLRSGDRLASIDWGFAFQVDVVPGSGANAAEAWFRTGTGRAGDRIRSFGSASLQCVIGRAKPAHTAAIFTYPVDPDPAFLFDFTSQD